jgi:hypothetical protein
MLAEARVRVCRSDALDRVAGLEVVCVDCIVAALMLAVVWKEGWNSKFYEDWLRGNKAACRR